MLSDITVLSTACGAIFMPGFFKCLKNNHERKIRIVGVDMNEDCAQMELLVDKYYQVPPYTDCNYIDVLLDICVKEKVTILFPHISMELPYIHRRLADFTQLGILVAISNNNSLKIANNKYLLYKWMLKTGVYPPPPTHYHCDSSQSLKVYAHKLGYPQKPFVVKMTENSGSRGVRIVKSNVSRGEMFMNEKPSSLIVTLDEMCSILDSCTPFPDIIAMKYLPGVEYTVDLLAHKGKTLYIAGRRNLTSISSIAQTSVVEKKEVAYQLCKTIVEKLKLDGNIGFDFMLDEHDYPWLTDLNPRVTATIILYAGAGLNFPYLRIKQLLGEEMPIVDVKYGTKIVRKYMDLLYNDDGEVFI